MLGLSPRGVTFSDSESLSQALAETAVSAVQITRGQFRARLDRQMLAGWVLQHVVFLEGGSSCAGDAARDRFAVLVPISLAGGCRLLGADLEEGRIGVYAPGAEHADVSTSGLSEMVVMPPPELLRQAIERGERLTLPESGSSLRRVPIADLIALRRVLLGLPAATMAAAAEKSLTSSIADVLERALVAALSNAGDSPRIGRAPLPRPAVLRSVADALRRSEDQPLYATDLARIAQVSYPTLRRIFMEWFGVSPVRYLLLKRLYLARRRILSGQCRTVTEAATSCGFWELGRFSQRYRDQFGEPPSSTLARAPSRRDEGAQHHSTRIPSTMLGVSRVASFASEAKVKL